MTGDDTPLAYIWIEPVTKPNIDNEIKIDTHLMQSGIKLSKRDMLQRYGRTEADPAEPEDAVEYRGQGDVEDFGGLNASQNRFGSTLNAPRRFPNAATPFKNRENAFKNARGDLEVPRGGFSAERSYGPSRASGSDSQKLLEAVARDTAPAADVVKRFMELLESGATEDAIREQAAAIMRELPSLLPDDPALATVIRDAITEAYVTASLDSLAAAGSAAPAPSIPSPSTITNQIS
jgi:hypothetical protein